MVETGVPGLEQTGWDALRGQLNTLDTSLLFLALLTGATALSWAILSRQRGALLSLLSGEDIPEPDLIPARLAVSALVVGSLSYFFLLSLETLCTARSQGAAACASAGRNARASLLVLAAWASQYAATCSAVMVPSLDGRVSTLCPAASTAPVS